MAQPGRHRIPRPTRLLVLIVAALVGGGVLVATGSAAADSEDRPSALSAERGDNGRGDNDREGRDGEGRDQGDNDRDRGKNDDGKNDDGKNDDGKNDGDKKNDGKDKDDKKQDGDKKDGDKNKDDKKQDDKKDKEDEEFPGRDKASPPDDDDFVDIRNVRVDDDEARRNGNASNGSFVARCGTNANGHLNSDNFMVAPGKRNGAQHVHDYVGNLSTDAFSDDDSLHAAGTTCDRDNKSTFFWPVLRDTNGRGADANEDGGGKDGNIGRILRPRTADLRFLGNPRSKVVAMPDDLNMIMGDAKAKTNGDKNARAKWTCTGFENRTTDKYPLCPGGSRIVRILDFPSCWDGENLDSEDHRTHVVFPDDDGSCDDDFKVIPQLRITLTYDRPDGRNFALDSFPDQQHDPRTDHADFMNIAPQGVLNLAADCINSGRNC